MSQNQQNKPGHVPGDFTAWYMTGLFAFDAAVSDFFS
jgi:hypothetical protein